ncbi:MAG: cysteine desulfurase family protein [Alphaproteobacteria bacterium]
MTPDTIYLDYNATAPTRPEAKAAVAETLDMGGNPSSVHSAGRKARNLLEKARATVADAVGASRESVVFTSGATESNLTALQGSKATRLIVCAVEHESILTPTAHSELPADIVPVNSQGVIDLSALERLLAKNSEGALVSLMLANNETGVIQPVAEAARLAHRAGARLHCDAVQALGKIPLDMSDLGVDSLSLSAHKLGGPQGVGALVVSKPELTEPLMTGGGQERNHRAGTENTAGIAGFAAAIEATAPNWETIAGWRDNWEARVQAVAPEAVVFSQGAPRLPNTSTIAMPGVPGDSQVMAMDLEGICISAGSACSSGKVKTSHVLDALGAGDRAGEAIRVSLGWDSQESDLEGLFKAWVALYTRTRHRKAG